MIQSRSLSETRTLSRQAEAAGLEWLGFPDSPVVYQDSFIHQAAALEATSHVNVGPFVTHVTIRHPLTVANALATMQESSSGRVRAAIGTGNSGATGLGVRPSTLAELSEGVTCMRAWWDGHTGTFRDTRVPASEVSHAKVPVLIAADGPKGARLAAEIGDGLVYSGGLQSKEVRKRAQYRSDGWELWLAPTFSLAETYEEVVADVGAQTVAMANRALRSPAAEADVPADLHTALRQFRKSYDYGVHADPRQPTNVLRAHPRLVEYFIDRFVIWGDADRWRHALGELQPWVDGVVFVFGHGDPGDAMRQLNARIDSLS